jgi:hypothetical protein
MTSYIVRQGAQKKNGILEKREAELVHSISKDVPIQKLEKAAEKVRVAQLAVIKCLLHETEAVRPEDEETYGKVWSKLEAQRTCWEEISKADIVARYSKA